MALARAVSLKEVAQAAGVAVGTASHVLNGNAAARIALATQDRVRKAASELGYRPNRFARGLVRGRTDTLGLFVSAFRNPFFAELAEATERATLDAGYHPLLNSAPSVRGSYKGHTKVVATELPVDGVVMWAREHQSLADVLGPLQAARMPVVYLCGAPRPDGADGIHFDLASGVEAAAALVLERGYRRPAYVALFASTEWLAGEARFLGYRKAFEAAGVPLLVVALESEEETRWAGREAGMRVAAMPAAERPDVMLCLNDVVAIGVVHGLRRAGLNVPEDVAVVGFDGIEEGQALDKPLTTVSVPVQELATQAVTRLLARIANPDLPPEQRCIPTRLLNGETL